MFVITVYGIYAQRKSKKWDIREKRTISIHVFSYEVELGFFLYALGNF